MQKFATGCVNMRFNFRVHPEVKRKNAWNLKPVLCAGKYLLQDCFSKIVKQFGPLFNDALCY
jgi:hypothetical protein